MSFWSTIGKVAEIASPVLAVADTARTFISDDSDDPIWQRAFNAGAHTYDNITDVTIDTRPGQAVMQGLAWTGQQASHGLSSAWNVGDISEAHGGSQWRPFWSGQDWENAWHETSGLGVFGGPDTGPNIGESVVNSFRQSDGNLIYNPNHVEGGIFGQSAESQVNRKDFEEWRQTKAGMISSGAADIVATWFADPTIGIGKLAKVSRVANTVEDATRAEQVSKAFADGGIAASAPKNSLARGKTFSRTSEERATRLGTLVASTDNMSTGQIAAHMKPLLSRADDAAPIVDLWGQAGRISNLELQRQVKADVLLAAMGSGSSRTRLTEAAPAIARAMQRTSSAPAEFAALDALSQNATRLYSRGDSLTAAARAHGQDLGNKAEIEAYGQDLDRIHRHLSSLSSESELGGLTQVGETSLDRAKGAYRARVADEFYYQPGSSSRSIRGLHWTTGQRSRGTANTADAFLGHDELMDHVARSGLFQGQEKAALSQSWFKANGQSLRNKVVDDLWDTMLTKVANKHGMHVDEVKKLVDETRRVRASGSAYTTEALERARAEGKSRVTIEDPITDEVMVIDAGLFETHIRKNVALPDTKTLERIVREHAGRVSVSDRMARAEENLIGTLGGFNDIWRLAVLARPGLFFRTQLDTQARVASMIGTTSVFANAAKGTGNLLAGRVLRREQQQQVAASASALAHREDALARAADLRRQAGLVDGSKGAALVARADQIEAAAEEAVRSVTANKHIGTTDKTLTLPTGQKIPLRAYDDASDEAAVRAALYKGGNSLSDAMTHMAGNKRAKYLEDTRDYTTHMPDSREWADGYIRGVDPMLGSYTGKKLLAMADEPTVDVIAVLRKDPKVRAEWLNVRFDNPRMDDWLDRAYRHTMELAPNKAVRQALLSGKRLDVATVERLFQPRGTLSPAALAPHRKPLVVARQKAEDALANDIQVHGIPRTKAAEARREKLTAKRSEAQSALDSFDAKPPSPMGEAGIADRMPVQGPTFSPWTPSEKNPIVRNLRRFVSAMSDLPDEALGRHPMYVNRYYGHYRQLAERLANEKGELGAKDLAGLHRIAKNRAIKDVQQTLYDTARYTGAHHGVMRIISPFLSSWEDAMTSWSRIMYDDPKKLGALMKTWMAPERMGLITDKNGNLVKPGQPAEQKFIALPLPGPLKNMTGMEEFRIRKDSLNSVFQGEVPWLPGFGPTVVIPAQQVVARAFPELGDPNGPVPAGLQPFMRTLINGDSPKVGMGVSGVVGDVVRGVVPSWAKNWSDAFDSTSPAFTDVYQGSFNSQIIEARRRGERPNYDKINEKALQAARNTSIFRGMALGIFGASGEGSSKSEFYVNRYRDLMRQQAQIEAQGKTVEQKFNEQFPEAAGLRFSVSFTETGINAYLKTEDRAKKFSKDIQKNGEFGWFYVGSDNVASGGKDEFSASIYNAQSSRRSQPGSRDTQRGRITPAEMAAKTQAGMGWSEYQRVQAKIDLILEDRGLHSISQKGASDLLEIKQKFVAGLAQSNPAWRDDYASFDSGTLERFVADVARPATQDPRLKDRGDIKSLAEYLAYRDRALKMADDGQFSLSSSQGAELRKVLAQAGTELARQDIGFSQIWQRVLSREVDDDR